MLVLHTYLTTGDNPAARIQRFLGAMLEEGNTIKEIVKTLQLLLSSSRQMTKLHFKHTHAYAKTKVRIRIRHETGEPSRKRKFVVCAYCREPPVSLIWVGISHSKGYRAMCPAVPTNRCRSMRWRSRSWLP